MYITEVYRIWSNCLSNSKIKLLFRRRCWPEHTKPIWFNHEGISYSINNAEIYLTLTILDIVANDWEIVKEHEEEIIEIRNVISFSIDSADGVATIIKRK